MKVRNVSFTSLIKYRKLYQETGDERYKIRAKLVHRILKERRRRMNRFLRESFKNLDLSSSEDDNEGMKHLIEVFEKDL